MRSIPSSNRFIRLRQLPTLKTARFVGLVAFVMAFIVGCSKAKEAPPSKSQPVPQTRIVSLHDVTSDILVELNAQTKLVGLTELIDAKPETGEKTKNIPQVSGLESILAQRPTHVVGLEVVNQRSPDLVATLKAQGIEVYLPKLQKLDHLTDVITHLGAITSTEQAAKQTVEHFELELGQLSQPRPSTAPNPTTPVRVFVYDCCDPPFTSGRNTILNKLITLAGGTNIFGSLDAGWTHTAWENVIQADPQLIVIHAYAMEGQGDIAQKKAALAKIPTLAKLPTVTIPLGCALGGLRSLEGLRRLRNAINQI